MELLQAPFEKAMRDVPTAISNGSKEIGKALDDLTESLKSITAPLGIGP